jgi:hypothetical protein
LLVGYADEAAALADPAFTSSSVQLRAMTNTS